VDSLINLANVIYILSYFVQDQMRFRLLTITAAACLVAYFLLLPEPPMTIVYWNVFFILLNAFQLGRILIECRMGVDPVLLAVASIRKNLSKTTFCNRNSDCVMTRKAR
jgi:hypothetical protein